MRGVIGGALIALLLSACNANHTDQPQSSSASGDSVVVGSNAVGERCLEQVDGPRSASIYCGTWEQPSARITRGPAANADMLATLATASPWRNELNARFTCAEPVRTALLGPQASVIMQCVRRIGGWPQVAMVTLVDGTVWYLDGVSASMPVMPRALSVLTGQSRGAESARDLPGADALLATRLAAQATKSGDIGQYEQLMAAGTRANLADSPAAAERAFRAALELQQKALGANNPNTADPMMLVALQLSNQGKYAEAEPLFDRAAQLARQSADPAAVPRLLHYRGLDELNQNHPNRALGFFSQAEAGYRALLPPDLLSATRAPARQSLASTSLADLIPNDQLLIDPVVQSSLLGVIEVRRNRAIAFKEADQPDEAAKSLVSAADLSRANNLLQPIVTSRLYRTQGMLDDNLGEHTAATLRLSLSSDSFTRALPGSRSYAITGLLHARELLRTDAPEAALRVCHDAIRLLTELHAGTDGNLLMPCLDTFAQQAVRHPDQAQVLRSEMFEAAQLAQSSLTTQQIAQASARLLEGARDPKVAEAIRKQQDAIQNLSDLYRQRSELAAPSQNEPRPSIDPGNLAKQIASAEQVQAEADSALQAASPGYGQLVQQVATARSVLDALRPNEVFISTVLADSTGWAFALRDGHVDTGRIDGGTGKITSQVKRIRASVELNAAGALPDFAVGAAQELYASVFGTVTSSLDGASALVVAPSGPLLSLPFGLMMTGKADPQALAQAPWLIRRVAISHVPAPANFVSLRKLAGTSRASSTWFGLGDFQPIPLVLAERSFPGSACQESARDLAGLPRLPFAARELEAARQLLGGQRADELIGHAYTAAAVQRARLSDYRVLHFASHALLPAELKCQNEPAIVTSAPAGAKDASGALLTASEISALNLDADVVILSACNSGGPGNSTGGESLSGLARAFFFAGARSLLVTHWSINDQSSAFLVADTLRRLAAGHDGGLAGALQAAQLDIISRAGKDLPANLAHPFYWAPFALIGEGRSGAKGQAALGGT